MAALDNADFTEIARITRRHRPSYNALQSLGLDKAAWKATFQAAEDWFVNGFNNVPATSFKAALEAQAGTLTNPQAITIGELWFQWRVG